MEGDAVADFQDWELLANSESDLVNSPSSVANSSRSFLEIEAGTEGMFRLDYFSLENDSRHVKTAPDASEEGSVESDNPSWIDPVSETRFQRRNSGEFWPDSGVGEIEAKEGKLESLEGEASNFEGKSELGFVETLKDQVGLEGFRDQSKDKEMVKFWSDSDGENVSEEVNLSAVAVRDTRPGDEGEKRKLVVWWKVPFEVLRYCIFRLNPVWSVSVAAAVMGFVILGRRLYNMRRKTKSLQLKVTVDDKVRYCGYLIWLYQLLIIWLIWKTPVLIVSNGVFKLNECRLSVFWILNFILKKGSVCCAAII
ncbi:TRANSMEMBRANE PROTEIN [Salix purpurea]|uniref:TRANSMEMBRANE PROTEIN n=1 Tax=Salix purpurea TaxID=77065 RepID=A0A9Q0VA56_SALPP|nr:TRANSMEMBRANE PROTEIN [Salix purpurea]